MGIRETKEESVHYVHLVKKEKKVNLEEMVKMDFLGIEVHLEGEVFKVKLEKMVLQECLDHKDQWVSQETLVDQDKKEIKARMQFTNHYPAHLDNGGSEESQGYQEYKDLKETLACLVLMVYQGEMVLGDLREKKVQKEMVKKEILDYLEIKGLKGKRVIQDQREQKGSRVNVQYHFP